MTEAERIIKLETQMDNIEKKVDGGFKDVITRLDALDQKFASKWVEKVMIAAGSFIGLAILGALLALIIKQ